MKRVLILLLLAGALFACRRQAEQKSTAGANAATAGERSPILQINEFSRSNADFKSFISQHYADILKAAGGAKILSRLFDQYVEQEIVLYKARREGFAVGDDEVRQFVEQIKKDAKTASADPQQIRDQLTAQKYLYFRVYQEIQVTPQEVDAHYNGHIEEYRKSEEILLQQIMVRDHGEAVRLRSELLASPGRFEEIARRESKSPEASSGGQLGYFEKGVLPKEMESIVFALQVGEISPITETPYGFHIFRVTKIKKRRLLAFANVAQEIREKLLSDKLHAAYRDFMAAARRELTVTPRTTNLYFAYVQPNPNEVNHEAETQLPAAGPAAPAGQL